MQKKTEYWDGMLTVLVNMPSKSHRSDAVKRLHGLIDRINKAYHGKIILSWWSMKQQPEEEEKNDKI